MNASTQKVLFDIWALLKPFVTPVLILGGGWFLLEKVFKLGELHKEFETFGIDITDVKSKLSKVINNLQAISSHLVIKTGLDSNLLQTMSPLRLTTKGLSLLVKSGFDKIFKENKDEFIEIVNKNNPKSLLEIDEASSKTMESLRNDDRLTKFKDVAFENGTTIDMLLKICAIYLRDEAAKELLK